MKKIVLYIFLLFSFSCNKSEIKETAKEVIATLPDEKENKPAVMKTLQETNNDIILYFKEENYKEIADFIHPEKGLRFSMYLTVNPESDQLFTKQQFLENLTSNKIYSWGQKDGTGEILKLNLRDYLKLWVFNKDYSASVYSENQFENKGNSINNLKEIYPNSDFTVNYLEGTTENAEMDWNHLIFVYEKYLGKYYIVGVINDRWTV